MTEFLTAKVLGWILPIILGPLVYVVARQALNVHDTVDNLPPIMKRIAVGAIGLAITVTFQALGVALPAECVTNATTVDCSQAINTPAVLQGLTAAAVALFLHHLKKAKPNT